MNERDRVRWARALSLTGWMFVLAYLGLITSQVRRAFAITNASFDDGLWWQRVETISFVSAPQNLMVLVPAAASAAIGTVLVRGVVDRSIVTIGQLVRVVAGIGYVVILLAALGIVGIFFRSADGVGDVSAFMLRLGGIAMSVAIIRICLEAEQMSRGALGR